MALPEFPKQPSPETIIFTRLNESAREALITWYLSTKAEDLDPETREKIKILAEESLKALPTEEERLQVVDSVVEVLESRLGVEDEPVLAGVLGPHFWQEGDRGLLDLFKGLSKMSRSDLSVAAQQLGADLTSRVIEIKEHQEEQ